MPTMSQKDERRLLDEGLYYGEVRVGGKYMYGLYIEGPRGRAKWFSNSEAQYDLFKRAQDGDAFCARILEYFRVWNGGSK